MSQLSDKVIIDAREVIEGTVIAKSYGGKEVPIMYDVNTKYGCIRVPEAWVKAAPEDVPSQHTSVAKG